MSCNLNNSTTEQYYQQVRKKRLLFIGLLLLACLLGIYAISQGAYPLSLTNVIQGLMGNVKGNTHLVVWNIRMPRIVAAIIAGWGLSLSGLIIQSLLRNPLGSPSTLGISQGAAFGAALAIILFESSTLYRLYSVTLFAFLGAMSATWIILLLARLKKLSAEAVILAGVALSSLFHSGTVLVQYFATETQIASALFWTFGDVSRSGWKEIGIMSFIVFAVSGWIRFHHWNLNALLSGEETAKGLGVSVESLRIQGMVMATLISAVITAFHGVIAFLGLLAPHIARRMVGADHRLLIPFSCCIGAILLLLADTAGRLLIGSGNLPVGVLTSFMGAPLFLYLLIQGGK
ncbi:MAG: iron ABC transporter permease [Desulfobacterales bacterium]|nr:iron ABC transporter permease [Desulfobacterales bacterium]